MRFIPEFPLDHRSVVEKVDAAELGVRGYVVVHDDAGGNATDAALGVEVGVVGRLGHYIESRSASASATAAADGAAFLARFPEAEAALASAEALRDSRRIRMACFCSSRVGGFSWPGFMRNLKAEIKVCCSGVIGILAG